MDVRTIVDWDELEALIVAEQSQPTSLVEIRHGVEAVVSYVEYSGQKLERAVDVICDELGIPLDRDRRLIRNAAAKRMLRDLEASLRYGGLL